MKPKKIGAQQVVAALVRPGKEDNRQHSEQAGEHEHTRPPGGNGWRSRQDSGKCPRPVVGVPVVIVCVTLLWM